LSLVRATTREKRLLAFLNYYPKYIILTLKAPSPKPQVVTVR